MSESTQQSELNSIEHRIQVIESHLEKDRLGEMREEVKGQGYMIADWNAYSNELEKIRQNRDEQKQMELEKQTLQDKRKDLLRQTSQPSHLL